MADMFENKSQLFYGNYRALVIANNDPIQAGRKQARVLPMFYSAADSDLPWAVPAMPLFSGSGNNQGSFCVPDVGTYVWVFFEAGRITEPVFFAEASTATLGIPSDALTNYPNRHVIKSSGGIIVYIDDTTKTVTITVPSGGHINLGDESGDNLVKVSDITNGNVLSATSGSPVTWLPVVPHGTVKVKAS